MDERQSFQKGEASDSLAGGSNHSDTVSGVCNSDLEAKALAVTREFFAGSIQLKDNSDPEDPDYRWRVVIVSMKAAMADILATKSKWHRRMYEVLGAENVGRYTICVVPESL